MLIGKPASRRACLLAAEAGAVLVVVLGAHPVAADDGQGVFSAVNCSASECQLKAGTPRRAAVADRPASTAHQGAGASPGSGGNQSGHDGALPSNCWMVSLVGRCLATSAPEPQPSPGAAPHQVSPEVVARQAVSQLHLPLPGIGMNPEARAAQVVHVPTWMWIDRTVWRPVSKTVEVPGVAVTATATPQRVVWSMGDGDSVTCMGPGTPYSLRIPAASPSPDCGYVYRRSSAGRPDEVFTVTATVMWDVAWQGGGKSGRIPGLRTATQVPVRVTEVQGMVVAGSGAI